VESENSRATTSPSHTIQNPAVDDQGSIYAADVGFNNLRKYIKVQ
jgi:hypothetical protein